jgi:DnaJ homolog subfamily C member 17
MAQNDIFLEASGGLVLYNTSSTRSKTSPVIMESEFIDYYQVLGLPYTAKHADIRKAWRAAAKLLHPDKNPDNPNAAVQFGHAKHAYQVLTHEQKKQDFDAQLRVRRNRELRRAQENAEQTRMREQLVQRERAAQEHKLHERRKSAADLVRRQNQDTLERLRQQSTNSNIHSTHKYQRTQSGSGSESQTTRRHQSAPATDMKSTTIKVKWGKRHAYNLTELKQVFGAFGPVEAAISVQGKKRSAFVMFDSRRAVLAAVAAKDHLRDRDIKNISLLQTETDTAVPASQLQKQTHHHEEYKHAHDPKVNVADHVDQDMRSGAKMQLVGSSKSPFMRAPSQSYSRYEQLTLERIQKAADQQRSRDQLSGQPTDSLPSRKRKKQPWSSSDIESHPNT